MDIVFEEDKQWNQDISYKEEVVVDLDWGEPESMIGEGEDSETSEDENVAAKATDTTETTITTIGILETNNAP